ncbi:MAG: dehydrogenase [Candidatus Epulonipiscioides saccharophilum]|nr:MAG: dehydrogenase [Epulopiscium sp. AS2M-Bin001]
MKKLIIIGAVAAGTSAAAKARRNNENISITVYDKDSFISYSNCGMPYYIGGEVDDIDELTPRDVNFFKKKYNVDIHINTEVIDINPSKKMLTVRNNKTKVVTTDTYDKLIIATGATAKMPLSIRDASRENVFCLRSIKNAQDIKHYIEVSRAKKAIIVGSGFIGFEMYENLVNLGLEVTMLELSDKITSILDPDMSKYLRTTLEKKGVNIKTSVQVEEISDNSLKLNTGEMLDFDLVIFAVGVTPNVELAKMAGIKLGEFGAIKVDRYMKTNIEDIYACGDCIETFSLITQKPVYRPMGTVANKTGRIAGDVVTGGSLSYHGNLGTTIFKIFNYEVACTGLTETEAIKTGIDIVCCHNIKPNKPIYMGGKEMLIKAIADKTFGKLIGVQIIGEEDVDKRIDVFATLITYGAKVEELFELDLAYSPPFSTTKGPVNYTGMILNNAMHKGRLLISADQLDLRQEDIQIIDTRSTKDFDSKGHIPGAINIPVDKLRATLSELDKNKPIAVYCNKGVTGNAAQNILLNFGFKEVFNVSGGHRFYNETR